VELAGLAHTDPSTLLGGLCDLGQRILDPTTAAHCKSAGEPLLDAYFQRKWHRKHPSTPVTSKASHANAQEEN
jgi:hypothetical protein